ncbi:MAG: HDOD domain-containing protein [Oligoflexia bacterium]|nr:HDOD domain-containing protein [Oligoflexia bacterium]
MLSERIKQLSDSLSLVPQGTASLLENYFAGMAIKGGEYPMSLSLVHEARKLLSIGAGGPDVMADLLSTDPVIPIRLLALANSAMYSRNNPVESLQGVIQHLGFRRTGDSLAEFGDPKNYQAVFLGRALAAGALQQMMLSMEIGREIARVVAPRSPLRERVPLWSQLTRLPVIFLAYIRPQLFSLLHLDQSQEGRNLLERNLKKATGRSIHEYAVAICDSLALPLSVSKMVSFLELPPWNRRTGSIEEGRDFIMLCRASFLANRIAEEIFRFSGTGPIDDLLDEYSEKAEFDPAAIRAAVGEAPLGFVRRMELLGMKGYRLPAYLLDYQEEIVGADGKPTKRIPHYSSLAERINPFLYELRASLKAKAEPNELGYLPQAVFCTLHALVRGLAFDRAVLYSVDETNGTISPQYCFGPHPPAYQYVARRLGADKRNLMPDIHAFHTKQTVFHGDPLFGEDWPFAAFPIVSEGRVHGIFYADKKHHPNSLALETHEQVAVVALAESWQGVRADFR